MSFHRGLSCSSKFEFWKLKKDSILEEKALLQVFKISLYEPFSLAQLDGDSAAANGFVRGH